MGWSRARAAAAEPTPTVGTVELHGRTYQALRRDAGLDTEPTGPGPAVASRRIELTATERGFTLQADYTIEASTPGFFGGTLFGPDVDVEFADLGGRAAPILRTPLGTVFGAWIDAPTTLRVRGFVPAHGDALALSTLPATRGRLVVRAPGRHVRLPVVEDEAPTGLAVVDGEVLGGASAVDVRLVDDAHGTADKGPLIVGHAAIGLTVGDAEIRGRARMRWDLRRGSVRRVQATVTGVGDDLQLSGPAVERWERSGDALTIELVGETSDRVEVELSWSREIGTKAEATTALPVIRPEQVWRADATLQLARDGEVEVIPDVEDWNATSAAELPSWGQGLVDGKPTAAFRASQAGTAGSLALLRFVPVPGPPVVVDVAAYTIATTEDGRVLFKVTYEVRNERSSHLRIEAPEGMAIIGARVATDTATVARDSEGAWRIPLKRSLETVGGLLSFPVEVVMLGEQTRWERRERRELVLPTVDAPIAASRATLYLPPQYRSKLSPGEGTRVEDFTEGEGITYGLGVGGEEEVAAAEALFQDAVEAYRRNEFDEAQKRLDDLQALGANNENVANLQGNLDLVEDDDDDESAGVKTKFKSADVALERRIKDQAKARAADDFRQQEALTEEAEQLRIAGEYDKAERKLDEAVQIGGKLAKLEHEESVEQRERNVVVQSSLAEVKKRAAKRKIRPRRSRLFGSAGSSDASASTSTSTDRLEAADGSGGYAASVDAPMEPMDTTTTASPVELEAPPLDPSSVVVDMPAPDETKPASGADLPEPDPAPEPDLQEPPPPEPLSPRPVSADFESEYSVEGVSISGRSRGTMRRRQRRGRGRARGGRFGFAKKRPAPTAAVYDFEDDNVDGLDLAPPAQAPPPAQAQAATEAAADGGDAGEATRGTANLAGLPAPTATATALSVVIPDIGQRLLYQQLLIDAGQTQTLQIDARKYRRSPRRRR
jgi:hypothetical protein